MATIGQLSGALLAATNQNTLALANFTLDFSLIKMAAPKEYEGLGTALSQRRRENAEEGPLHRTARRLGALFEQIIPPIPSLVEAYGQRVSEIAAASSLDLKNDADYGPLAQHVGVDGTSIYAAATSGSNAIALHLLACMLARSWSGPEATSIWVELVAERKKEIIDNSDPSQMQGMFSRIAAQQEITRAQLAAWDASARAWLRTADDAKKLQQTQLRLIAKDSGLPLGSRGTTYHNVIEAWCVAMTSLQKLIQGIPQNISKGSILVGLLSWHIYPDLNVVDPTTNIQFHDPLVKVGGIVTLGLERLDMGAGGVHWSLALSHLRFYGDPVPIERSVGRDPGRLTISELHLVTLGAVLSSWRQPSRVDINIASECFVALGEAVWGASGAPYSLDENEHEPDLAWLRLLVGAAYHFTKSTAVERKSCVELIEHGRRSGRRFLDECLQEDSPMFGLVNKSQLFQLGDGLNRDRTEHGSIEALQDLAKRCKLHPYDCIIQYLATSVTDPETMKGQRYRYHYTRAIPDTERSADWRRDCNVAENGGHEYWVHTYSWTDQSSLRFVDGIRINRIGIELGYPLVTFCPLYYQSTSLDTDPCPCVLDQDRCVWSCICDENQPDVVVKEARDSTSEISKEISRCPPWRYYERYLELYQENGSSLDSHDHFLINDNGGQHLGEEWREHMSDIEYNFLAGDEATALLLSSRASIPEPDWNISELTKELRSKNVNRTKLVAYLKSLSRQICRSTKLEGHKNRRLFRSLNCLVEASALYREWPGATVSMEITNHEIGSARWSQWLSGGKQEINFAHPAAWRSAKFACIAMLESGVHDFSIDQLSWVFAIAAGDSIYVAEPFVQDPSLEDRSGQPQFRGIRRILGNLGRPGIVMLIPPQAPRLRKSNSNSRTLVQPKTYDGSLKDYFGSSSLHLMFTEYEIPLAISPGAFDAEVVMLEALVSVYEGRDWVADLDVLGTLFKSSLRIIKPCSCARASAPSATTSLEAMLAKKLCPELKSIQTWDQLLFSEQNLLNSEMGIFQSHNNWHSRLAAAAICGQLGYPAIVLPSPSSCTACNAKGIADKLWILDNKTKGTLLIA